MMYQVYDYTLDAYHQHDWPNVDFAVAWVGDVCRLAWDDRTTDHATITKIERTGRKTWEIRARFDSCGQTYLLEELP